MEKTIMDKFGRQLCPKCRRVLRLYGAWSYNGRIYPDKYAFRCEGCSEGYVGDGEEMELHQNGIEAAKKDEEVTAHLSKLLGKIKNF